MVVEDPRLPRPRRDVGKWGAIMNKIFRVGHNDNGTHKDPARGSFVSLTLTENITVGGTGKFKRILAGGVDS